MASDVLVSIITVSYNSEKTISLTLESVAKQTYRPIEYIIIDGSSTDGTINLIKGSATVSKWVSEPDDGIAEAFNKGLALATGEWIGIINSDDWYEFDAVAAVMEHADTADLIHGPVRYWDRDTPKEIYFPNEAELKREMTINHPSVFVRRSVYDALGGFDVSYRYAMDYEFLLRALAAGYRFCAVQDVVLANMRFGGASDLYWQKAVFEVLRAKETHFPSLLDNKVYCGMQLLRGYLRRLLEQLGFHSWIRVVRSRWSVMRKH
jgi:glycosyltransferase involved in cell wall biosynthesis